MMVVVLHETEGRPFAVVSVQPKIFVWKILPSETNLRMYLAKADGPTFEIYVGRQVIDFALVLRHLLYRGEEDECETVVVIPIYRYRPGAPQAIEWSCIDERIDDETRLRDEIRNDSTEGPQKRMNVTGPRGGILEPASMPIVQRG